MALVLVAVLALQDPDPSEVLAEIRAGRVPQDLARYRQPVVLDAIARRLRDGPSCPEALLLHLAAYGGDRHASALFDLLRSNSVRVAYTATVTLASFLDARHLPRLKELLGADRKVQIRALTLAAESRFAGAGPLLLARLSWLSPSDRVRARALLRALGGCRVRKAHMAILEYYGSTEEGAAVTALGRIWETRLDDPPLERSAEIDRLSALLLARRLTLRAGARQIVALAALRIMTRGEFETFLRDHARARFAGREAVVAAALSGRFQRRKADLLLPAFLESPDTSLVAEILARAPRPLPESRLAPLLDRTDPAPKEMRLCDWAAWRLSLQSENKRPTIPSTIEARDARIKEWKERLRKK